jgi:hypothetical protein
MFLLGDVSPALLSLGSVKGERLRFLEGFAARAFPLGRVGHPNELEGLVALLASDASGFITGAPFVQDGAQLSSTRRRGLNAFPSIEVHGHFLPPVYKRTLLDSGMRGRDGFPWK